jgi:hypothetical protein
MYICKFCKQERKNNNSLRNHERLCKLNPEKQHTPFQDLEIQKNKKKANQWTKGNYVISDNTRKKMSEKSKMQPPKSKETIEKLSKLAKERNLGGVRQSKWIKYKGKTLGSTYELILATSLDENNIRWDTCKRFNYIDPYGKSRTYTPDIYLIDYDVYLDPKNDFLIENINPSLGFSDKEKIKKVCEQNNINIIILNKNELSWDKVKDKLL